MINQTYIKFHQLPETLKNAVTSPEAMEALEALEAKYGVSLAELTIRLMVKEVLLSQLSQYLRDTLKMDGGKADALVAELRRGLLQPVLAHLEAGPPKQQPAPLPAVSQARPTSPSPTPKPVPLRPVAPPTTPNTPSPVPSMQRPPVPMTAPVPPRPVVPTPSPSPRPAMPTPLPASPILRSPSPLKAPQPTLKTPPPLVVPPPPPAPPPPPPRPQYVSPSMQPRPAPPVKQQRPPMPTEKMKAMQSKAAFYLHPEDEADIARHRDRLLQVAGASPTAELENVVRTLTERYNLSFADEVLMKRFQAILLSRLRDVRTSQELQELLLRPVKIGGLGLDAITVTKLIHDAEDAALRLHDSETARHLAMPSVPSEPSASKPTSVTPVPPAPVVPPPPVPQPKPAPMELPKNMEPTIPVRPRPTEVAPRPTVREVAPLEPGKPMIHDVKRPKPMSLVDELADLSVDDFRNLGHDLAESAAKVAEKIHVLAEDSFAKRAEGISAWRRSGIYQLYLELGRQSMAEARPIENVISLRKHNNQPYLTAAEFTVVADLNRQLTL